MAARIYSDKDADLRWLKGKKCAVIGFGAQGRAHALNLRDSGINVIVGLYPGSKSRVRARRSGLEVLDTPRATQRGDVIFLALPDSAMPRIYGEQVATNLRRGQTLLFAHGFAIHYRTIVPRRDVDVIMVAPKGLGPMVRREFLRGRGAPGLIAIHQNPSRHAKQTALAWAKGIGCARAGVIETTFREETETDLFGEQAVLCGGTSALIRAGFDTLVDAGYPPELAYFECLHELKLIVDLIYEGGIGNMNYSISNNAEYGEYVTGPKIVNDQTRAAMRQALRDIQTGEYAKSFIIENRAGAPTLQSRRRLTAEHPIEQVGEKLRAMMPWIKANKLVDKSRN